MHDVVNIIFPSSFIISELESTQWHWFGGWKKILPPIKYYVLMEFACGRWPFQWLSIMIILGNVYKQKHFDYGTLWNTSWVAVPEAQKALEDFWLHTLQTKFLGIFSLSLYEVKRQIVWPSGLTQRGSSYPCDDSNICYDLRNIDFSSKFPRTERI